MICQNNLIIVRGVMTVASTDLVTDNRVVLSKDRSVESILADVEAWLRDTQATPADGGGYVTYQPTLAAVDA